MRHFGNPIGGPAVLGGSNDRPSRGDTLPLTHSPLTGRSLLEPFKFSDTFRDKIALAFFCLFTSSVALFFGTLLYIVFFWTA